MIKEFNFKQLWKKKQHKNYQDEDKKSAINKKINSQIYKTSSQNDSN